MQVLAIIKVIVYIGIFSPFKESTMKARERKKVVAI